ncbi:Zinc finger CCCH domain-containing protein 15 [Hypsibius exemplaris]|uniref:Zinc finger CCCH domain-containing protein 15 n=1 Tax=Hypsibius exemplaris TaxID=2072580 RepID=A0A1W0X1G2_HYPEX|nr:Zinc finger CCCH domain-containing protein 15 [Hypsibius exemplaris]
MPPKTNSGASKKTVEKQKQKIVEDKTFGLKNKKGNKQQQFIQQVAKAAQGKPPARRDPLAPETQAEKKAREKAAADELKELFKPVIENQKVAKDVDPKSVLCAFFKAGQCGKGDKCKFSHDVNVERRTEKRNLYADVRAEDEDTMDTWDDAKLADVVTQKHAEAEKLKPKTDIVCKHFLQAIEENKYGWFWTCPNGGDSCMYKHALPAGFVLKKDKKKMEDQEEKISLDDLIEKERAALGGNLTRVTLETFKAWKIKKRQERIEKLAADKAKKENEFQAGRLMGLSGRDMFTFKPELADGDDEDADDMVYSRSDSENEDVDEMVAKAIDESLFLEDGLEENNTGITQRDWSAMAKPAAANADAPPSGDAGPSSSRAAADSEEDVPIDADLFADEDDSGDDDDEPGSDGDGPK